MSEDFWVVCIVIMGAIGTTIPWWLPKLLDWSYEREMRRAARRLDSDA